MARPTIKTTIKQVALKSKWGQPVAKIATITPKQKQG